jgi:hypothetical protein
VHCAQSPETSTLDLGLNKALDSTLPKLRDFHVDKFEQQIHTAWAAYPSEKIDALFNMKERVTKCIREGNPCGGNDFSMPHRKAGEK